MDMDAQNNMDQDENPLTSPDSEEIPVIRSEKPVASSQAASFRSESARGDEDMAEFVEGSSERSWYVIHCYSGYENKVRHNLEQRIETMGVKDKIFDVVIPTQ